jgi:hypothetical protein
MKLRLYICIALFVTSISACEKDNLKEPTSTLTGSVTFQGQPVGVRQVGGTPPATVGVIYDIFQPGYAFFTPIPLFINHDGSFKATLFDGDYKIVRRNTASGPWVEKNDTISVSVKGSALVDIPVEPYFIIKNASFTKTGSNISATFTVEKNGTHSNTLERAAFFIGRYSLLDANNGSAVTQPTTPPSITLGQPVTLTWAIPASIAGDDFIFARVGVKTRGITEYLFTQTTKIQLK